jgi:putrescine aminotransferase
MDPSKNEFPTPEQAHKIIEESKQNFAEHYNRNWLEYRKSVTESGDWAAVEWSRLKGSTIHRCDGTKYLDWLGGFGMLDLGWSHPEVVEGGEGAVGSFAHAFAGID